MVFQSLLYYLPPNTWLFGPTNYNLDIEIRHLWLFYWDLSNGPSIDDLFTSI